MTGRVWHLVVLIAGDGGSRELAQQERRLPLALRASRRQQPDDRLQRALLQHEEVHVQSLCRAASTHAVFISMSYI